MVLLEDDLETRLLALGREELAIEQKLKTLKASGREAAKQGKLDVADAIFDLFESLRSELPILQTEISKVERELYGLRSRRKR